MIILDMPPQVATIEVQQEQSIENIIFNYFIEKMGLNKAAALGIMANIQAESEFNISAGSKGGAYGLCQWCGSRRNTLLSWSWDPSVEVQLVYIQHELENGYVDVLDVLKSVEDTEDGAAYAAYYFCKYYERPSNVEWKAQYRAGIAKEFWPQFEVQEEEVVETYQEIVLVNRYFQQINPHCILTV